MNEFKALSDDRNDTLIKTYDQLWLLVIDKISLVSNRMSSFINHKLCVIKQMHNEFMGSLDVFVTCDFYQDPPIWC